MPRAPTVIPQRLRDWLAAPHAPWIIAAIACVACMPALWTGLAADDFLHAVVLADPAAPDSVMFDAGWLEITRPWWTQPEWHARFTRPLTVLTHRIDHVLWPDAPWAMHLVSLGWYAALVVVTGALLRELGGPRWVVGLALWMFALDDAHASTVAWIAARGSVVACTFGMLTLVLHIRSRRRGAPPVGASLAFVLALASGEVAVCTIGYLVAYAMFVEPGARRRWWSLAPYVVIVLGWLVVRWQQGFGTGGTGLYLEPWMDPLGFVAIAGPRVALLVASALGLPLVLDPLAFFPGAQAVAGVVSLGALVVLALLLRPVLRDDAIARFFAGATVLSAIPLAATVPQDRHALWLGAGAFGLVSRVVLAHTEGRLTSRALRFATWSWVALHVVLAPLLVPLKAWSPVVMGQMTEATDAALPEESTRPVVLFAAPTDLHIMYTRALRITRGRPHPDHVHTLYTGLFPVDIVRSGPRTLDVHTSGWFASPMSRVFRDAPMAVGATVDAAHFVAEVLAIDDAGHPTDVRFTFPCVLERCAITWLRWEGDRAVVGEPPREGSPLHIAAAM